MKLTGLHILLTYTCNYECDHCFVWGSPWQTGVFTSERLENALQQACDTGTISEIYFEGGEAFLYYALLLEGIRRATELGLSTGVVSNGYWATDDRDARLWLEPLAKAGLDTIDISSDTFHGEKSGSGHFNSVKAVAFELGLKSEVITIERPSGERDPSGWEPGLPLVETGVMYRGRAATALIEGLPRQSWDAFPSCPYENLEDPGRLHLDPFGYLHLCQGLVIGNIFRRSLNQILDEFDPRLHPIVGSLIAGGPSLLMKKYLLYAKAEFVDACHACYTIRRILRTRHPEFLGPDQMYGAY
jgi:Radical SAM superfamily